MEYEDFTYENIHNETNIRRKELDEKRKENIKIIAEDYKKYLILKIRVASSSGKYEIIINEKDLSNRVVDCDWTIFRDVMEYLESFFKERGFTYTKKYHPNKIDKKLEIEISWR